MTATATARAAAPALALLSLLLVPSATAVRHPGGLSDYWWAALALALTALMTSLLVRKENRWHRGVCLAAAALALLSVYCLGEIRGAYQERIWRGKDRPQSSLLFGPQYPRQSP